MPAVEVWIVMDESGNCEAATDKDDALVRLEEGLDEDLAGTVCRFVRLNVQMSEPRAENGTGAAVDVVVPDDAGHTKEVEG
jgi:hypothetical protein